MNSWCGQNPLVARFGQEASYQRVLTAPHPLQCNTKKRGCVQKQLATDPPQPPLRWVWSKAVDILAKRIRAAEGARSVRTRSAKSFSVY